MLSRDGSLIQCQPLDSSKSTRDRPGPNSCCFGEVPGKASSLADAGLHCKCLLDIEGVSALFAIPDHHLPLILLRQKSARGLLRQQMLLHLQSLS
jgi:hypothetical protein